MLGSVKWPTTFLSPSSYKLIEKYTHKLDRNQNTSLFPRKLDQRPIANTNKTKHSQTFEQKIIKEKVTPFSILLVRNHPAGKL